MTPEMLLTPLLLLLAFIGYVTCLRARPWGTLVLTGAVAGGIWHQFGFQSEDTMIWAAFAVAVLVAVSIVVFGPKPEVAPERNAAAKGKNRPDIVLDGTNVMYWDGEADLDTLRLVVNDLKRRKMVPFVFLDASSRHHLGMKSLDERGFAKALSLPHDRVMVCPARTEADAFILKFAREHGLPIVSNDRFGDRAQQVKGLKLIKGGIAAGKPILHGI